MIADARTITRPPVSAENVGFFHENGPLVVEDLITPDELEVLNRETVDICRGRRGLVAGLPPFTAEESDEDVMAKTICVHFPHKVSDTFHDALAQPGIVEHLKEIIGENVKCMQSMLLIKSAGKPGQAWHQDEAFIPTRDRSLTAAWIAMDDATSENGCLWVIPGSHRRRHHLAHLGNRR